MQKIIHQHKAPIKSKPQYSRKSVQRAGEVLTEEDVWKRDPESFKKSMNILSDWRAEHESSLDQITDSLRGISKGIDRRSNVVKRLKRTPSILNKLRRFGNMKLSNMHDIAGCRAIVSTSKNVQKIKRIINKRNEYKVRDYIKKPKPKPNGYRGVHLIGKFKNKENGRLYPVEIQIRSRVQHSWATAVEIVDLFTSQSLKSDDGKKAWLDFFKYLSHEFSKLERISNPPIEDSLERSIRLLYKLDVYKKLEGYAGSLKFIESHSEETNEGYNLVQINLKLQTVKLTNFPLDQFEIASKEYLKQEKTAAADNDLVVALVSTDSIVDLKEAYPNYFADSALFVQNLRSVEQQYVPVSQKLLARWLSSAGFE